MKALPRQRLRLALRDLAAFAAFGAMAISGELPAWSLLAFALGLGLALFGLRPLAKVSVVSGVAVAACAVLLYSQVAVGRLDLVVAACAFAALIALHRILSAPTPRTDHQVLLTSLLMISGGAALSGELLFALMLLLFATCACLSLVLAVVERTLPSGVAFPVRPLIRRMGLGVGAAVLGAALCFVFLPRVSWNAFGRRTSPGLGPTRGLGDGVRLGEGRGRIQSNPRIVARLHLAPDPGVPRLGAHWLAATYGDWDGRAWSGHGEKTPARRRVELRRGVPKPITQQIELLPAYGSTLAIALVEPLLLGNATAHRGNGRLRTKLVWTPGQEIRFAERAESYTYFAYSAPEEAVLPAPALSPAQWAQLTSLPPTIDPRIRPLASQVLGSERRPLAAAHTLEKWLQQNYGYTLELPDAPADPLADFLFERKRGHCEYFATALALMLRTQGFAARVATGFYGGERVGSEYVLRAGDAHAWTQVYVPGRGFVNLDATPQEDRGAKPFAPLAWALAAYERLDEWWRGSVLDFTLRDQFGIAARVAHAAKAPSRPKLPSGTGWLLPASALLGIYALWRVRLIRRGLRRPHPAAALRSRAEALLAQAGYPPSPGEGLEAQLAELKRQKAPAAAALQRLTLRYLEARFGPLPLRPEESEALLTSLRASLRIPSDRSAA